MSGKWLKRGAGVEWVLKGGWERKLSPWGVALCEVGLEVDCFDHCRLNRVGDYYWGAAAEVLDPFAPVAVLHGMFWSSACIAPYMSVCQHGSLVGVLV